MTINNKLYYKQGTQTFTYDSDTKIITAKTSFYGYYFRECYALGNGDVNNKIPMSTASGKTTHGGSTVYFLMNDEYDYIDIYGAVTEQGYINTTPDNATTVITYGNTDIITVTPNSGYDISDCKAYLSSWITGTVTDNVGIIKLTDKRNTNINVAATITEQAKELTINQQFYLHNDYAKSEYDKTTRVITITCTQSEKYAVRNGYAITDDNTRFEFEPEHGSNVCTVQLDKDYTTVTLYGAVTLQGYLISNVEHVTSVITYGTARDIVTITPETGYKLISCSVTRVYDTTTSTIQGTVTDNVGTVNISSNFDTVTVNAVVRPETVVTNNIDNSSFVYDDNTNILTVLGDTGYKIQSCTANCDGTDIIGDVIDGVCTFEFGSNYYSSIILNGDATEITTNITNNIVNSNYTYAKTSNVLTVQGTAHYTLQSCTVNCDGTDIIGDVIDGVCTFEFGSNYYSSIILSGVVIGETITITNNTTYVDGDIPTSINYGDTLTLSLTPQDGYTYETTQENQKPYLRYRDTYGDYVTKYFTVENEIATINFKVVNVTHQEIEVLGGATPKGYTAKNYGTVNVYVVTNDDLNNFAKRRYQTVTGETTRYQDDVGNYIYSIKRVFLPCENGAEDTLKIGDYNYSDIKVHQPSTDTITLQDSCTIMPMSINYNSVIVQLFLPFKGLITLPKTVLATVDEKYINRYVGIKCDVNILSGKGTYNIYIKDDEESEPITVYCEEFEPSSDLYYTTNNISSIGQLSENDAKENWGLTPYIIISYDEPLAIEDGYHFSIDNNVCTRLSRFVECGLCKFTDIHLQSTQETTTRYMINQNEYKEIMSLMESGIIL